MGNIFSDCGRRLNHELQVHKPALEYIGAVDLYNMMQDLRRVVVVLDLQAVAGSDAIDGAIPVTFRIVVPGFRTRWEGVFFFSPSAFYQFRLSFACTLTV
jgi:hypothetical protein